jgi:2,3-bisphosphoglycerate-dependent phosphoglycerate mutase
MTDAVEIVFETHSLTVDNERGIATGCRGGVLSDRGRTLAAELGARRRDDAIDVVLCSDLARAVETARIAFGRSDVAVVLDWRLREVDYGELNGSPVAVIERERRRRVDTAFPGGESYRDAVARVGDLLGDVRTGERGTRVLVIGHTATRWGLDHLLHGKPLEELVEEPFDWREGWEYRVARRHPAALRA